MDDFFQFDDFGLVVHGTRVSFADSARAMSKGVSNFQKLHDFKLKRYAIRQIEMNNAAFPANDKAAVFAADQSFMCARIFRHDEIPLDSWNKCRLVKADLSL